MHQRKTEQIGWRRFVFGGVASCIAEMGTYPIDMTKTRLQIQGQQTMHLVSGGISPIRSKYNGMFDALLKISKEEGIKSLYRGLSPALLRQSIYGSLKFGIYYSLKHVFPDEHFYSNILCATLAGGISSSIANPTDVLKVRMQLTSNVNYNSLFPAFKYIYQVEGLKGLWRGVSSNAQRASIIAAVELPVYDGIKKYFIKKNIIGDTILNHTVSSFVASLAAVIASTPNDVIRTRMMSQKLNKNNTGEVVGKVYKNSFNCLICTVKYEGFFALYKGFFPAWLRMGPWNILFFISYEKLLKLI